MLDLICSARRADNIDALYDAVGRNIAQKKKQLILVPETHSHRAEKRLLHQWGNGAGRWAQVMTFTRLADRALEAAGKSPETVDPGGRVLLMYKAVRSVESSLTYYRQAAGRADMLSGLISVASEFRSCRIEPEQLLAGMGGMSRKLQDISLIYAAYCAQCAGRAAHGSDRLEAALEAIASFDRVREAGICIYGFQGFTAAEYGVIEKLLQNGADMTVALDLGSDPQLFAEQAKTRGRLERLAADHGLRWNVVVPPVVQRREEPCLEQAADCLFDFSIPAYTGDSKGIKLYSCKDVSEECELVAGLCRQLVLSGKARLRDIAVVSGEAEQYEKYLEQSFQQYGLPIYSSRREDFLEKPAAAAALGAFRAVEDHFSFQSVLRYLKSDLMGLDREEQELLENYAYTWQIRGNNWFRTWDMSPDGYDGTPAPELLERLNDIRLRLVGPLDALRQALPASAEGKVYTAAVRAHMERTGLQARIEQRAEKLQAAGRRQEAAEYVQICEILSGALEQFDAVMGEDVLARQDFLPLLEMVLSQYTIGTIPVSLDAVEFSDFQRAAFGSVRYLFVLGAREGALPPAVTGSGLLRERDRIQLETCGISLTQSDDERISESLSAVYQVISSAVKQICFIYPRQTFGGVAAAKSYLLGRLETVFPQSAIRVAGPLVRRLRLLCRGPAFELLCTEAESPEGMAAAACFAGQPEGSRHARLLDYAADPRGRLSQGLRIEGLYGSSVYMSATRAEKFYSCPFSFFMQYGLRAKERKTAAFEATNVGTLVHYVVENAVRTLSLDPSRSSDEVVELYVDQFLRERLHSVDQTARFAANYAMIRQNIKAIVRDIMEEIAASDFVPIAFEMDFGGPEGYPPYTVRSGRTALELHGQIDRVDGYIRNDVLYVRVSDYKTGSKAFTLSDILSGLNMQMFIYLLMLQNAPEGALRALSRAAIGRAAGSMSPCAALYIPAKSPYVSPPAADAEAGAGVDLEAERQKKVRRLGFVSDDPELIDALERSDDGRYRFLPVGRTKKGGFTAASKVVSADEMQALLDLTRDRLTDMAGRIAKGDIQASPYIKGNVRYCDWCPYQPACQFDAAMRSDRYRYIRSYKKDELMARIAAEQQRRTEKTEGFHGN
ncbi:MAG: PD-(D/E)XK nuclease family protein [Butyricicoccaceae bacterium]